MTPLEVAIRHRVRRLRDEDGQSLVLMALFVSMILVISVVVIDGSNLFVHRRSLQNAADAAALAAAQDINTSTCASSSCSTLKTDVQNYVNKNWVGPSAAPTIAWCGVGGATTNCIAMPYVNSQG